jgi:hypothetical protein
MNKPTLEERVAALEEDATQLKQNGSPRSGKDWTSSWGMFTGDKLMKEIMEEGRKIRKADRKREGPLLQKRASKT